MQVHSVVRWCFERQPRWAREKGGENLSADSAPLAADACKDEVLARAPRPCRTLTNDGLSAAANPNAATAAAPVPALPVAPRLVPPTYADVAKSHARAAAPQRPPVPLPAALERQPRWMLTPALLGLDSWPLLSAYDEHFKGQVDLLLGEVQANLTADFFVTTRAVADQAAAERLIEALWGGQTPGLHHLSALSQSRPDDVVDRVRHACRAAKLGLEPAAVQFAANLLRLHGLEIQRRQMHHSLMVQAQNCAFSVSTTFGAEAREEASQLLANHQLDASRALFLAPEGTPPQRRLAAALSHAEALDEFAKLLEHFQYWRWRERIPPSERTELTGRTPHTFYTPSTRYGDHVRDVLLGQEEARAPEALLPPRYSRTPAWGHGDATPA